MDIAPPFPPDHPRTMKPTKELLIDTPKSVGMLPSFAYPVLAIVMFVKL